MLLLQLIIATAVTLALARPVSSFLLDQPERTIFVLDMTTSMTAIDVSQATAVDDPIRRFDVARQIIHDHVQALDENDSFAVISLSPHPRVLLVGEVEQKTSALLALDKLVPGAAGANLSAALTLTNGLIDPSQKNRIIVLTDGNYPLSSQMLPSVLASLEWRMIPTRLSDNSNQALFNVSSRRLPDGRYRVLARVANYSDSPVMRTLRLVVDDRVVREDPIEIEAQAGAVKVWTLGVQAESAVVEIIEPDILPIDNRAELLLFGTAQRRVLLISEAPDTLARALAVQPGVELTIQPFNEAGYIPDDFDLVVFDGLSVEVTAWPRGNVLVVNPPLGHSLLPGTNFARNLRPDLETASSLFAGIDLSGVLFNRVPRLTTPEWAEVDLRTTGSETEPALPLIFHGNIENSQVMVWTFDLTASNLPARLALPLLTANMLSTLLSPAPQPALSIGESVLLAHNFNVEIPDGRRLFLDSGETPSVKRAFSFTKQPGLYKIYDENNTLIGGFAVHAGSPLESNLLLRFQPDTLAPIDASAIPAPDREIAYEDFWPWLAGLALVIVTIEGWLAWRR
jgi:hypothetical protein